MKCMVLLLTITFSSHLAAMENQTPNLNHKNSLGNTILHEYLMIPGSKKHWLMRLFFPLFENPDHHIDINAPNNDGNTPLHIAAQYQCEHNHVLPLLLFYGADPTSKNNEGKTPGQCCFNNIFKNRCALLKDMPDNGKRKYALIANNRWTQDSIDCYSLCEFEKQEILPYLLSPKESARERRVIHHNCNVAINCSLNITPSCGQLDNQDIIPCTNYRQEYEHNLAVWKHDYNERYKDKEKQRFNITRRLREREYGRRMQEQLYVEG